MTRKTNNGNRDNPGPPGIWPVVIIAAAITIAYVVWEWWRSAGG